MANTTDLTKGNSRKQLIALTIPILISNVFSELYNVSNSLIVGNYIDTTALSAVSACTWICNIFSYMFFGLGLGSGILVAQKYGAKDEEGFKEALDTSVVFAVVGGIILTIAAELFLPQLMHLCNIKEDIYVMAEEYLRIYLLGSSAILTYQICFYIVRSMGDTKHQLYYMILSSLINLGLGVLFVRVMDLGIKGTALATIIAQFVVDILGLRLLFSYDVVHFDIHDIKFRFRSVVKIMKIGIPAGIQNMLIAFSSMLVQSYINMFPNETIAGIGVGEKIGNWGQRACNALSAASQAMVAQNIGAKEYKRVQSIIKDSVWMSFAVTLFLSVLIFIFAPQLVAGFDSDPEVIRVGTIMARCMVPSCIFLSFSHIYNGACRGAGNVREPMLIAVFAQVICKYMLVFIGFRFSKDVRWLYTATAFGYVCAGVFATIYFNFSRWTKEHGLRA